jgi:hypothetical protein
MHSVASKEDYLNWKKLVDAFIRQQGKMPVSTSFPASERNPDIYA